MLEYLKSLHPATINWITIYAVYGIIAVVMFGLKFFSSDETMDDVISIIFPSSFFAKESVISTDGNYEVSLLFRGKVIPRVNEKKARHFIFVAALCIVCTVALMFADYVLVQEWLGCPAEVANKAYEWKCYYNGKMFDCLAFINNKTCKANNNNTKIDATKIICYTFQPELATASSFAYGRFKAISFLCIIVGAIFEKLYHGCMPCKQCKKWAKSLSKCDRCRNCECENCQKGCLKSNCCYTCGEINQCTKCNKCKECGYKKGGELLFGFIYLVILSLYLVAWVELFATLYPLISKSSTSVKYFHYFEIVYVSVVIFFLPLVFSSLSDGRYSVSTLKKNTPNRKNSYDNLCERPATNS